MTKPATGWATTTNDGEQAIDQSRTHNPSNQIAAINGSKENVAHDLNGNMVSMPGGKGIEAESIKMKWDAWNRLVEMRLEIDDSLIGEYTYDGIYRRTIKKTANNIVSHFYYNTEWRPVEGRKSPFSNPTNVYYWGAYNRWELIRRDRDTNSDGNIDETIYSLKDALDPIAIVDWTGTVKERYQYDAFGGALIFDTEYEINAESISDWNYLFHGEFQDSDSGFYNYGSRYYHTKLGRWSSKDPIEEEGGVNLYGFVGNNAIFSIDLVGLAEQTTEWNDPGGWFDVFGVVSYDCDQDPVLEDWYDSGGPFNTLTAGLYIPFSNMKCNSLFIYSNSLFWVFAKSCGKTVISYPCILLPSFQSDQHTRL